MVASLSLQASPFSDDFVDVPGLNAHVSDHVLARLDAVRTSAREGRRLASTATVIVGPAGGGKTHLLGRIRQAAGPKATLVLMRPYFGVSLSLRDVLAATIDQLWRCPKGTSLPQIHFVLAHWLEDGEVGFPSVSALEARARPPAEREARVERAVARVIDAVPELAPVAHFVRAFLGLGALEGPELWAELAWLSGREPRAGDGATGILGEGDVLRVLSIVAMLAAPVATIALVFDQLENLATEGDERVLGYGNLISELVDSVGGLTIVQLALTSEWMQFIEPHLSLAQRTRSAADKLVLALPTEEERRQLLLAWQSRLAPSSTSRKKKRLGHPLSEEQLDELLTAPGVTPRILAAAYTRALAGKPIEEPALCPPVSGGAGALVLTELFEAERARASAELEEKEEARLPVDGAELAEGLSCALSYVARLELDTRLERERVTTIVRAPGGELTLLYLVSSHHVSVAAGLARAAEMACTTKVALVREKRFEFPPSWVAVEERRAAFERLPNARFLWLERDDVARCLALARLSSLARAKRLRRPGSEEVLTIDWVQTHAAKELSPAGWSVALSVERWLTDVPREARAPASSPSPEIAKREAAPPSSSALPASAAAAPTSAPAAERMADPVAALREWVSMGRGVGSALLAHWFAKLRARR